MTATEVEFCKKSILCLLLKTLDHNLAPMFGMGLLEFGVICIMALLILGPNQLPKAASTLGLWVRKFRLLTRDLKHQIEKEETIGRSLVELSEAIQGTKPPEKPLFQPAQQMIAAPISSVQKQTTSFQSEQATPSYAPTAETREPHHE